MIGVAYGAIAAAVPFILSRLATGGARPSTGGLFRTHTVGPLTEPTRAPFDRSPIVRRGDAAPIVTRTELPPATMPLIDPWADEPTAQARTPAPQPMPMPPPMTPAPSTVIAPSSPQALTPIETQTIREPEPLPQRLPAIRELTPPPAPSSLPWDGPGQTQLPTREELAALPAPPAMPEPPPFVEAPTTPQATADERPPQERGELPAELATLPASTADTPPDGYDPIKAKSLAKQVASNITNRGNNYSRDLLKQFQRFAGIAAEGIYGGESRGALEFFGVRRPPKALFKPTATIPYRWATWS